jgi:beta-carotene hydroxylase
MSAQFTAGNGSRTARKSWLRNRADLRTFLFLAVHTLLIAGLWTGIFRNVFAWYAAAWLAVSATTIKHNHMHHRTFRSRWANTLLDHWLGCLTGSTTTSIITEHNLRHHGHNNTDDDFVRASLVRFRSQWLNFLCFFPRAFVEIYLKKPVDLALWWRTNRRLFWRGLFEQLSLFSFVVTLALIDWRATLLCLVLLWVHAEWWQITFSLLQHQDLESDDPWQNSRNITGRWFNFFFFNIGYHTAHHLRPTLHWSELPRFHAEMIAPRIHPSLVSPSLWVFYRDWFSRRSHPAQEVTKAA